ncbi:GNAT family N-acetyltransferase [Oleomonas cavernae]|uniref:GNAT family N-acetyltransferase n=1 Tax=Oleomonas cavernae TaxID=2320859 RepID=UPI0018F71D6C|nr:GNAT family N-acetyltransferase [Oleomonas cavernae]
MVTIRDPRASDEAHWRVLWDAYVRFYRANVPEAVTAATWARIMDPAQPVNARLAELGGQIVGFATSVVHPATWSIAPICYLEDLFVDPKARGAGAGRALIEDLMAQGKARGWAKLYWHTQQGNTTARILYDRLGPADDFVRYVLAL